MDGNLRVGVCIEHLTVLIRMELVNSAIRLSYEQKINGKTELGWTGKFTGVGREIERARLDWNGWTGLVGPGILDWNGWTGHTVHGYGMDGLVGLSILAWDMVRGGCTCREKF